MARPEVRGLRQCARVGRPWQSAAPVVPETLDQLAALAAEHVEIAAAQIGVQGFLHQQGQ